MLFHKEFANIWLWWPTGPKQKMANLNYFSVKWVQHSVRSSLSPSVRIFHILNHDNLSQLGQNIYSAVSYEDMCIGENIFWVRVSTSLEKCRMNTSYIQFLMHNCHLEPNHCTGSRAMTLLKMQILKKGFSRILNVCMQLMVLIA